MYALLEQHLFDVIIPVSDKTVPFISRNKDYIEGRFGAKCAVPDYRLVHEVEDKSRFMSFCESNGISHPRTGRLTADNLKEVSDRIGFPALIKPDYSVGARGITRVDSYDELQTKYGGVVERFGTCTLQELIDNKEYYYNVMLYRDANGFFPAYTILKIVRMFPVTAGSSTCCITVENDELLTKCKECLDRMEWVGMADFDVLQRLDDKSYKIIEINPRVPASLRAAAVSGINFPELIVRDAQGEEVPEYTYTPGKILRYLGTDLLWMIKSPNRFQSQPNWFSFFGKGVYYQDIYGNDPSTWWTWLIEGILKIKKRNKRVR